MSPAGRLEDALLELEVSSQELRSDPSGRRWLPAELRQLVDEDEDARRVLAEWVEVERSMYAQAQGPNDALFTARVMRALPAVARPRPDALRRHVILAAAHALAIGVGYLALWPLYEGGHFQPWVDDAQRWVDSGVASVAVTGVGGPVALALLAAMLLLLPRLGSSSGQLRPEA